MSTSAALPLPRTLSRPLLQAVLLAVAVVLACGLMPVGTAAAAPMTIAQCNGILNVGGQGLDCSVTVVNAFDATTGLGSSTVTVQACTGAANAASTCTGPTTTSYPDVTTTVQQCNGSGNGGGATATCTVSITNNITGGATPVAATVNQCIGSGGAGTAFSCNPVQSTTGATVTQCNGSADGGGGAITCTVPTASTQNASLTVSVNQCNGSARGGGAVLTCRTSLTNNVLVAPGQPAPPPASASSSPSVAPAAPSASPSTTASASPSATPSAAPSPSPSAVASASPSPSPPTPPTTVAPIPAPGTGVGTLPDETGVLPEVLAPVAAPSVDAQPNTTAPGPVAVALPTTGADTSLLSLLGLLTLTAGGALVLLTRRPRGRHVLR